MTICMILALLSGLVGGIIILLFPSMNDTLRKRIALSFTLLSAVLTWKVALDVFSGNQADLRFLIGGLSGDFHPDTLSAFFALIISTLWVFATVYSFGYMHDEPRKHTYYAYFLISFTVSLGVAFAGNLVSLYLFYELLTFVTYPLVIHKRDDEAIKAGTTYILFSLSGAGLLLIANVITYAWSGNIDFGTLPILSAVGVRTGINLLLALYIIGFGVKAAMIPLHPWLPKAMVAPTPVSALLHAVAVVNTGVYGGIRVIYSIFGYDLVSKIIMGKILPGVALFTIIVGSIIALKQDYLKKRLAYSTISQLSYILLGAFTLHPLGLTGALVHMISHSVLKIILFFCAGIIAKKTHKTRVSELKGLGWQLPWTFGAFAVASIGMIGMLPLSTFWSKFFLMRASLAQGSWLYALGLIISGLLNAFYLLPIVINAFSGEKSQGGLEKDQTGRLMLVPTVALITFALVIGICPGVIWPVVDAVVKQFFIGIV
jgi:multicomponent Na+:H+ antiporter subunit D